MASRIRSRATATKVSHVLQLPAAMLAARATARLQQQPTAAGSTSDRCCERERTRQTVLLPGTYAYATSYTFQVKPWRRGNAATSYRWTGHTRLRAFRPAAPTRARRLPDRRVKIQWSAPDQRRRHRAYLHQICKVSSNLNTRATRVDRRVMLATDISGHSYARTCAPATGAQTSSNSLCTAGRWHHTRRPSSSKPSRRVTRTPTRIRARPVTQAARTPPASHAHARPAGGGPFAFATPVTPPPRPRPGLSQLYYMVVVRGRNAKGLAGPAGRYVPWAAPTKPIDRVDGVVDHGHVGTRPRRCSTASRRLRTPSYKVRLYRWRVRPWRCRHLGAADTIGTATLPLRAPGSTHTSAGRSVERRVLGRRAAPSRTAPMRCGLDGRPLRRCGRRLPRPSTEQAHQERGEVASNQVR